MEYDLLCPSLTVYLNRYSVKEHFVVLTVLFDGANVAHSLQSLTTKS